MKFTCTKSDFSNGINIALKAVPGSSSMPILKYVMVEANNDQVKLTTNDMELGIETVIDANVEEPGIVLIDAKMMSDMIRKLPEDEVSFEVDDSLNVLVFCGKLKFNFPGMAADEFPNLPTMEKDNNIVMSQFSLKEMIRQTIFSISDNENNKILTGELFEIKGDELKVASLDLHRVSIRKIQLKESFNDIKVVIPGKALNEISKIMSGNMDDEVTIFFSNNYVMFELENTIILTRLIEGNFYNVDQMISNEYETKVKINKQEFLGCIDRATLLLRDVDKKPIVMNIEDDRVKMEMKTHAGSMDEDISIDKEGKDMKIGFNPKFLIDVLKVIDDEEIFLYLKGSKSPCFIKDSDESYIYLILPVNLVNMDD